MRRHRSGPAPTRVRAAVGRVLAGAAALAVVAGAAAATTVAGVTGTVAGAATPGPAVVWPPMASVILDQALPGFTAAPPGPTNGPLTASEFAAQSSDPKAATAQFDHLSGQRGFGAYLRLWTDITGAGKGANDVVITLFRIPDLSDAAAFEAGTLQPYQQSSTTTPFAVPSIPGAHGFTESVSTPARVTEQAVVFRTGPYVGIVQLASVNAPTNPTRLTPADAISVAYRQELAARAATPKVTTPPPPPPSGGSATPWVLLGVLGAIVVGAVLLWLGREEVGRRLRPAGDDPWSRRGVLAAMGAGPSDLGPTFGLGAQPVPEAEAVRTAEPVAAAVGTGPPEAATAVLHRSDGPAPGTPAGWLPDPSGAADTLRYWDGAGWTEHVAVRAGDR